jgi:2,3-dihydroxybiphenyl 1,2-dioxygenase
MSDGGPILALSYLSLAASDINAWQYFADEILGLPVTPRDGGLDLRLDAHALRIRIDKGDDDDIVAAGWEVADALALEALVARIETHGFACTPLAGEEARARRVAGGVRFVDPEGARHEACWGPEMAAPPPRGRFGARFKTGDQGLGHIVLACRDKAALIAFYVDVLGLRISDHIETEIVPGRSLSLSFLRCNPRHHSLALAQIPQRKRLVHLMVEVLDIDDVGLALQRCEANGVHISMTLGRHSNDKMLSFYGRSPSGFDVEFGWGGLAVDEDAWRVEVLDRTSVWGHRFQRPPRPQE